MEKILISACLLGDPVRYDGQGKLLDHPLIQQWQQQGRLVPLCPEVAGGLPTPRPPAEINQQDGSTVLKALARVMTKEGEDVTEPFVEGAQKAWRLCQQYHIQYAILTANSPSCGSDLIYDGTFSGVKKTGDGVTAALLKQNGVRVFSQHDVDALAQCLAASEI